MDYNTKVIVKARLNWPALFEPKGIKGKPDSPKTYQAVLLIDKQDKKTIKEVRAAIDEAIERGIANKDLWAGEEPEELEMPLMDGDKKNRKGDHPEYEGCWFINAKAKPDRPPGVIDRNGKTLTSEKEIFAGCYVLGSVDFYPYTFGSKDGIACGLNNIMKVKDGPAFSARNMSATDDFADFISDDGLRKKGRDMDEDDEEPRARKRRSRDEDEDEDPAPRKSRRRASDDEDEDPAPKRKAKRDPFEDDEEDEAPKSRKRRSRDEEDEDPAPRKSRRKPFDLEDDDVPF